MIDLRALLNLENNIMASLLFSFGSLAFISFLAITYFCKEKNNSIRPKVYKIMIYFVLFILFTGIINTYLITFGVNNVLSRIIYILHWTSYTSCFCTYYVYSVIYLSDLEANSLSELWQKSAKTRIMVVVAIMIIIAYLFIPTTYISADNFIYFAGKPEYYIMIMLILIGVYITFETYVLNRTAPTRRKIAISLVMVAMLAMAIAQLLVPKVSLYPLVCSAHIFFLYFIMENPDIQVAKEIDALKSEIDKSNRAKTDFLNNMSHEIRTPMNAIVGFSDSLLNSPKFDENIARNDIQSIATASNNLLDIINNILDISKIESGKEVLDNKEYNIGKLINDLSNIVQTRIGNNPIKLHIYIDKNIPSVVYGDSTKLYQVLLNIASNSVKYTEVGRIQISCEGEYKDKLNEEITLHFKISDTGYGIKKEDFNKMFEKFSRLDNAVSNEIEGTGLGLAITKRFVDLMGGKIWFTSEYEIGTTFYIDIPLKVIDQTPIGDIKRANNMEKVNSYLDCSNYTALVVDDNKLNIKVAERILKKYNFKIDTAESGKDCVFKFKSGTHYDIIFLDHMMPEMDGIETLHILKRLDDYYIPPIVALTANAITGMKEMYLREGFDSYLSKPINVIELDKVIHKYFENDAKIIEKVDNNKNIINEKELESNKELEDKLNKKDDIISKDNEETIENNKEDINTNEKNNNNDNDSFTNIDTNNDKNENIDEKNDIMKEDDGGNITMEEFLKNNNVDLEKSLEFLGDMEMYNITIQDFKNESLNKWDKIKECFDKEDMENYSIYVHALKSDCKYLGFMKLADISYQHELKSKEKDVNYVKEHFNELETEFNNIKDLVNSYVTKFNLN